MFDPGFNKRWEKHPEPQASLGDMFGKTGWSEETFKGKRVLDAGCGCGRYLKHVLELGAAEVVGIDSSPAALRAARRNAPTAELFNCDLMQQLPHLGTFDLVYSLGVLHHCEDPESAFHHVAELVRPGGQLAVWVYACPVTDKRDLLRVKMLHEITRAVDPDVLHAICERYAVNIRDQDQGRWDPLAQVLRVSTSGDDDECISDTFDWHAPRYRHWHSTCEVNGWFAKAGFPVVHNNPFPVSATGTN